VAAPIRKVSPSPFDLSALEAGLREGFAALAAAESRPVHDSLSVFGTVVSSTAPGSLQRASEARANIRRVLGLR
jgi:hypothetical protein